MYLTRFRVNTQRVTARRLLSSPQNLHAAVLSSFAEPLKTRCAARLLMTKQPRRGHRHRASQRRCRAVTTHATH